MNNLKRYKDFVYEMKDTKDIVKDLARRLSFDKDVVKYLNTSRAKREIGWRELLADKLHGKNIDYINYITKTMVADYNHQIVGAQKYKEVHGDFDVRNEEDAREDSAWDSKSLEDKVDDVNHRLGDVENLLGIDPSDEKSIKKVEKALDDAGYEAPEIEKKESDEELEEELEEEE